MASNNPPSSAVHDYLFGDVPRDTPKPKKGGSSAALTYLEGPDAQAPPAQPSRFVAPPRRTDLPSTEVLRGLSETARAEPFLPGLIGGAPGSPRRLIGTMAGGLERGGNLLAAPFVAGGRLLEQAVEQSSRLTGGPAASTPFSRAAGDLPMVLSPLLKYLRPAPRPDALTGVRGITVDPPPQALPGRVGYPRALPPSPIAGRRVIEQPPVPERFSGSEYLRMNPQERATYLESLRLKRQRPPIPGREAPPREYQPDQPLAIQGAPREGELLDQYGRPVKAEEPTLSERERLRSLYRGRLEPRPDIEGPRDTGRPFGEPPPWSPPEEPPPIPSTPKSEPPAPPSPAGETSRPPAGIQAPEALSAPLRPEGTPSSPSPVRPPGPRWTSDPGAIPGEPTLFLDGDATKARAAIIEHAIEGTVKSTWEARLPNGQSLGVFDTPEAAAAVAESRVPKAPRFERTPTGDQALIPGAEARTVPTTALRSKGAQADIGESPLFQKPETATQAELPTGPPTGPMIRLYRGEGREPAALPEWAKTNAGEWFTTSPEKARQFAAERSGQVRYVDIPASELEQYRAPRGNAADEYLVPQIVQKNRGAKLLESAAAAKPEPKPMPLSQAYDVPKPKYAGQHYGQTVDVGTVNLSDPEEVRILIRDRGGLDPKSYGVDRSVVPKDLLKEGGANWDETIQEIADAQSKSARVVERAVTDALGRLTSHKAGVDPLKGLAEIRAAKPPTDVPIDLAEWQAMPPSQRKSTLEFFRGMFSDESGRVSLEPLAAAGEAVGRITDSLQAFLAPASRGPAAERMAGILRPNLAELARKTERAHHTLRRAERWMEGLSDAEKYAFIDALETGRRPRQGSTAQVLRQLLDGRRADVQNLGTGKLEHFIEDYFPHLWKDPAKAADVFAQMYGRRPLAGPASFLKRRVIPTVREGVALGLEPATTNPVTATLLKLREMDRYVMGQTVLKEMKDAGLARLVPYEGRPPVGWARINDKIARAGSAGQYWAPEPAARLLNNYLSAGLQGNALYDAFRGLGNTMNQMQLGFSAFHLGFVSWDVMQSKVALAAQQILAGRPLAAARSVLTAPLAPFTSILKGSKILREYFAPGSQGQEMGEVVNRLIAAGGRARMDPFYGGSVGDQFLKALRGGRYPEATVKAWPAVMETISRPIMQEYVPRAKLGVFADLAQFELSKLPPGAPRSEVVRVLGRAWDSVENRLGQMTYDNLFWNRVLKDSLMASVRSVGWNLGTLRELGGGIGDVARQTGRLVTGRGFEMTPRMAYAATLPFTTAIGGAILNYLYTGKGPETLKDYFYPKTGRLRPDGAEDRVSLPTYMKDVVAYGQHPWTTVKHKLSPALSLISEMLENEDYYGALIRNPDDPLVRQMLDAADHILGSAEAFSMRNYRQQRDTDAPPWQAAQGFIGIVPAPAAMTRDPEVQAAIERRVNAQKLRRKQREEERNPGVLRALEERLREGGYLR